MSTVFSVKGIDDASKITEVEATVIGGTLADTGEVDDKNEKVYLKPREWFLTRDAAEKFLASRAKAAFNQKLKNLPDQYLKAVDRVNELHAEMVANNIPIPSAVADAGPAEEVEAEAETVEV